MIKPRARSTKPGAALLAWYDAHRRDLPWRARPGEAPDPYRVWLSEIMLQQTTVATVKERYAAFLSRWPAIEDLARAPLDDLLAQWAGLGYYARARNLHACARAVAEAYEGRFPRDEAALRRLPGVGPYTAAAIAAIAFDQPCVAVDGNVERVIARLHAVEAPPRKVAPLIREKAAALMSLARPGDSVQALMELGALICAPRTPDCPACPLSPDCAARRQGAQSDYPAREIKAPKPKRRGAIFILRRGDEALLLRRPPRGLFGGMNAFPSTPLTQDIAAADLPRFAPCAARWRALKEPLTHIFTHFALEATVFVAQTRAKAAPSDCRWAARANLGKEGLPTLMRKAAAHAGLLDA
ncbi:A/G-specific adenine glycosylase [Methylocystis sp.]|uniref:A/G-specific adenine glycosylase n=1 Tax=Methylocystis sp. TaxID=1911079 RepID=UPI003DA55D11